MKVLISYDITQDGARARVSAILQQWGDRVQKSVFMCQMSGDQLLETMALIEEIIDPRTDALLAVPLCASCQSNQTYLGQYHEPPTTSCWVVL